MRGVQTELYGGLVGGLTQVREEVADHLLTGVDDLASRSPVDGVRDLLAELVEFAAQLRQQVVG